MLKGFSPAIILLYYLIVLSRCNESVGKLPVGNNDDPGLGSLSDRKGEKKPTAVFNVGRNPPEALNKIVIRIETFDPSGQIKMSSLSESRRNNFTRKLSNDNLDINPDLELTFGYLSLFRNKLENLCVDIHNFIRTSPNLTKEKDVRQPALEELLAQHSSVRINSHFLAEIWREISFRLEKILSAIAFLGPMDHFVANISENVRKLSDSVEFLPRVRVAVAKAFTALMKDKHRRFDLRPDTDRGASPRAPDREDNENKFKISIWALRSECAILRERHQILIRNLTVLANETGIFERVVRIYQKSDDPRGPETSLSQLGLIANNLLDSFSEFEGRIQLLLKQLDNFDAIHGTNNGSRRAVEYVALRTLLKDVKKFNNHFDDVYRGLQIFLNLTISLYYHGDEENELDDIILETEMRRIRPNVSLMVSTNSFLQDETRNLLRSHAGIPVIVEQLPGIRNALDVLRQVSTEMNRTIDDSLSLVLYPPASFSLSEKLEPTGENVSDRLLQDRRPEKRFIRKPQVTVHFPQDLPEKEDDSANEVSPAADRPESRNDRAETTPVVSTPVSAEIGGNSESAEVDYESNFTNPFKYFVDTLNLYSDQEEENSHDTVARRAFVDSAENREASLSYF